MKSIDSIRDRLASILRETGDGSNGIDCSARRRAVMSALRAAVAEIDGAEWNFREAADYLGVSPGWVLENAPGGLRSNPDVRSSSYRVRFAALRAFKESIDAKRDRALDELVRMSQETGEYE